MSNSDTYSLETETEIIYKYCIKPNAIQRNGHENMKNSFEKKFVETI